MKIYKNIEIEDSRAIGDIYTKTKKNTMWHVFTKSKKKRGKERINGRAVIA